ncbi:rhodanese-like domain-containing protein [Atopobacter sp. AH10]|uniref:rhodanese-like domain-containing protein n=1 Tax=Atopobacter sp. AH10 TaxID=2315861 RepID=UPI000EF1B401|nr:rhodanese-like domain-containing protein [Atopobacter sp. AH10]RLK63245.1 rhodanese-like domain-containing protein [Atopobacter sp. AH10]
MTLLKLINTVLLSVLLLMLIWLLYLRYKRKKVAKILTSHDFNEDLRRTQIIDLREVDEFKAEHILGARNIPFSQFKLRYKELRMDTPIRLYGEGMALPTRAAIQLYKAGYRDIAILKGGYSEWTGKTKKAEHK